MDPMPEALTQRLLYAGVAIWLIACCATALAAAPPGERRLPSKVTFHDAPSSEKPAAREKRLKRECKGRPNAGMCLGYTR
jgi:hypothetical protein